MSFIPPNTGLWLNTPKIIRRFRWVCVDGDVGELVNGWLGLAGTDTDHIAWVAGDQHAPAGIAPRYVAKDAYLAMTQGERLDDGSLYWSDRRWHLCDVYENGRLVARLAPAEGSAV